MDLQPVELEILRSCAFKAKPLVCREPKCRTERPRSHERAVPKSEPKRWPECPACRSTRKPVQRQGCVNCGGNKGDVAHDGAPPSFNVLGSGDPAAFQALKQRWTGLLAACLAASGLPRGLGRVLVEGEATFPDRQRRDQGNYRVLLEKALGDTLVNGYTPEDGSEPIAGGWLEDDDWTRYEFGGLAYRYEAGVSRTRIMLFPSPAEPVEQPAEADLMALPGL